MTVTGDRCGPFHASKVCDRLKSSVGDGVPPEVLCLAQPEASANRQGRPPLPPAVRRRFIAYERPESGRGGGARGPEEGRNLSVFGRRCCEFPTARPRINSARGVDRAHPVMKVPVDGHSFPLLPSLNRRYVAVKVRSDFLPGIQPVFGGDGMAVSQRDGSPIALSWLAGKRHDPGNQIVPLPCNGTAKGGIRRQTRETPAILRLTA